MNPARGLVRLVPSFVLTLFTVACATQVMAQERRNFALESNGGVATASSVYLTTDGVVRSASAANDGNRNCQNSWVSGSNTFPQWLQIDLGGVRLIDEIDVFTVHDNVINCSEPTEAMTFELNGLSAYQVQFWDGFRWTDVNGGNVTGNNRVWRKFTFPPILTPKIRVLTNASPGGYSVVAELEAWGTARLSPNIIPGLVPPASPGMGAFQVRAVQSGLCLGYRFGDGAARLPYLALSKCDRQFEQRGLDHNSGWSPLIVVPYGHSFQGPYRAPFTLRSPPPYEARDLEVRNDQTKLLSCVTVARGVLYLGTPPSADILPCNHPASERWDDSGGDDQVFSFLETPPGTNRASDRNFKIQRFWRTNEVLDVRGASHDLNTELILWPPNGGENQVFHFTPVRALITPAEESMIVAAGYVRGADNVFWYAKPIDGWDLPGEDGGQGISISNFDLGVDDGGVACAQACANNADCAAYTWVKPVRSDRGRCWLKGRVPAEAVANPNMASGVVRRNFAPGLRPVNPVTVDLTNAIARTRINVALASSGGVATASSAIGLNLPLAANNGDRKAIHLGSDPATGSAWSTNAHPPAWLKINFNGRKSIDEIDVFFLQDDRLNPVEPTPTLTYSQLLLADFDVQYWDVPNSAWITIPGGHVTNNNLVWRQFSFAPVTTTSIRILVTGPPDGFPAIAEVEAWGRIAP